MLAILMDNHPVTVLVIIRPFAFPNVLKFELTRKIFSKRYSLSRMGFH
jgi:hypothetical protein